MSTLKQQLHKSATHRSGFDPACPECQQRLVEALKPAVLAAIATGCEPEAYPTGTVTYSKVDPAGVK